MRYLGQVSNSIFLLCLAVYDLREQKVPVLPCVLYGLCGAAVRVYLAEEKGIFLAVSAGVTALVFLLAFLFRKAAGTGDFLAFLACAGTVGALQALRATFLALLAAACYAAVLVLLRKAGKKDTFPFVPFMFIGQIVWLLGSVCSGSG